MGNTPLSVVERNASLAERQGRDSSVIQWNKVRTVIAAHKWRVAVSVFAKAVLMEWSSEHDDLKSARSPFSKSFARSTLFDKHLLPYITSFLY